MDSYTRGVKTWLEKRYSLVDIDGVVDLTASRQDLKATYHAHQPVYGPFAGHCEPGALGRFTITHQILKALSHFRFDTVADIGGGEGFLSFQVSRFFDSDVLSTDLSETACMRARELYSIDARAMDVHRLELSDGAVDLVVCSETLEHVSEPKVAMEELLRVARRAVIVTVPYETREQVENNLQSGETHTHIHPFVPEFFDYLKGRVAQVEGKPILGKVFSDCCNSVETLHPQSEESRKIAAGLVTGLLKLDSSLPSSVSAANGLLFVITKDRSSATEEPLLQVEAGDVLSYSRHYHTLPRARLGLDLLQTHNHKDLDCSIDSCRAGEALCTISGWAFSKELDTEFQRTSVVLRSKKERFVYSCSKRERPDVAEHFGSKQHTYAGFSVSIPTSGLSRGNYRVEILNHDLSSWRLRQTNCEIEITSGTES